MGYTKVEAERAYQREYKRKARAAGKYKYPRNTERDKEWQREYKRKARAAGKYNYPRRRGIKAGYVYLVLEEETGRHKIGVSLRNVEARITIMQSGNSSLLTLVGTIFVEDMYGHEKALHMQYADKNIRGEWYALSLENVKEILNYETD